MKGEEVMPEQPIRSKIAEERKWQEEADVHTLANAQEIQQDKKRLLATTKRATIMARDVKAQATKLEKVAKKKPVKRVVSRTVTGRKRR